MQQICLKAAFMHGGMSKALIFCQSPAARGTTS
jgi:hypothetical protein